MPHDMDLIEIASNYQWSADVEFVHRNSRLSTLKAHSNDTAIRLLISGTRLTPNTK